MVLHRPVELAAVTGEVPTSDFHLAGNPNLPGVDEVRDSKWAMILDEGNGLGALSESMSLEPT